jgi:hypothetical protein
MIINKWSTSPPANSTWVMASYHDSIFRYVKTCKFGCCVYNLDGFTMVLPVVWRECTAEELLYIDQQLHINKTIPPIDWDRLIYQKN